MEISILNRRIADSCQVLEEILKESQLDVVKASREEALVHLNESNVASQKILEERNAI